MKKVFIYWDNSNMYISTQLTAVEREGNDARIRVRIDFDNMMKLARADREIESAVAAGLVPPELRHVWNRLEGEGIRVEQLERGEILGKGQSVDQSLQVCMLNDALDYNGDPGVAVLLTGDGAGFYDGVGFRATIERMHKKGWRIEVLSWQDCDVRMKKWAEENGLFIALDDFYDSVTFLEPPLPGQPIGPPRHPAALDLSKRKTLY